jgi:hypothetical protein
MPSIISGKVKIYLSFDEDKGNAFATSYGMKFKIDKD